MRASSNRLQMTVRHHITTAIVLVIVALMLITATTLAGTLALDGSQPAPGRPSTFGPVMAHTATTSDNPILLLLTMFW